MRYGRHLTEEGQSDCGHDDADRVRRLSVQRSCDLVGTIVELGYRLGDPVLDLLAQVAPVVEHT